MSKTLLIIKREYITRIRKRTFIIGTILFPLLYLGMIFGTSYIDKKSSQNLNVAIIDSSGLFTQDMLANENVLDSSNLLNLSTATETAISKDYEKLGYSGYIVIPANTDWKKDLTLKFNSKKTYGTPIVAPITAKLNRVWSKIKYAKLGIDSAKIASLNATISVDTKNIKDSTVNANTAATIGTFCGLLMYIILLLYGSQVMMGVTEEKTNRIAEVMVSSVKPFQLMLGKIIGIGMVALTQFLIWIACIFIIYNVGKFSGGSGGVMAGMVGQVQEVFTSVNIVSILSLFIFYLLAGFFFYSSLYAAIGSAINEDMREAQSLSFPITLIIIFSIGLMTTVIKNPTGPVATWASIIPFSSPIVMMARIPFGVPNTVPWWQLGLSMLLLIGGFIFTTWFAGKIYRTGILMYGKKPSWKEMIKWAFRK
jgi:ABC-2 type transport system permease protein